MAPASSPSLPRSLVAVLAVGTAASVGTIYLSQPLLPLLGQELHATPQLMGLLVTVTQIGYGVGIVALVPLGDIVDKRRLILVKLAVLTLALAAAAAAPNGVALLLAHLVIGLMATAAQDFVPLAADLAPEEKRGRIIGTVMAGLLLGILVSRTFSGAIAGAFGWRAVFVTAAGIIAAVAGLVAALVPARPPVHRAGYLALIRSTLALPRTYPLLALATATQGLLGLVFSAFWTVLAFHLAGAPFHLGPAQIGTFGLAGAAGALAAPVAGRLADRHGPFFTIPIGIGLTTAAFVGLLLWPSALWMIALGAAVFDLGVQLSIVSHQSIIYAIDPAARSRMNGVFVGGMFGFFALGSFLGNALYLRFGWTGLVSLCLACCAGAFALHAATRRHRDAR